MPKGVTEQEKELIGKRLLEEGTRLFSAYGLMKTNVEEIARAAGISKGAFYHFYESKEALFLDVIEQAEIYLRQEVLATIEQPGSAPRARLFNGLKKAFIIFETMPILQFFSSTDFDVLFRRIAPDKFQQHLDSDRQFIKELIIHCHKTGIPIRAQPEQIVGLLYPLVITIINDSGQKKNIFPSITDLYLQLIAAFCLGEIEIDIQQPSSSEQDIHERNII